MCGNQVLSEIPSPNMQVKAVVFERDCGATTDFSTQVAILPINESLGNETAGNVFVADTDHGRAPSGPGGGPEVGVRWTSEATEEIQHHPAARILRGNSAGVTGIQVSYAPFSSPNTE